MNINTTQEQIMKKKIAPFGYYSRLKLDWNKATAEHENGQRQTTRWGML